MSVRSCSSIPPPTARRRSAGGLPAREAIAAYMAGAPVPLSADESVTVPTRLSVRRYSQPPATLWRRTVPAPRLNYPRYPEHHEKWQRFEMQLRLPPGPTYLANWCRRQRADWWRRFALFRFLQDAAEGKIVAYDPGAYDVPSSFFESDVDISFERGELFCRHDRRVPLRHGLRFYAEGDAPAAAIDRAARQSGEVRRAILREMAEHAAELDGRPIPERIEILIDLLPSFSSASIRSHVYRALAAPGS
jgi:hypothetical protein